MVNFVYCIFYQVKKLVTYLRFAKLKSVGYAESLFQFNFIDIPLFSL